MPSATNPPSCAYSGYSVSPLDKFIIEKESTVIPFLPLALSLPALIEAVVLAATTTVVIHATSDLYDKAKEAAKEEDEG